MEREKIQFNPNKPVTVELAGTGAPQENRQGETEYRYFLAGEQIMWVPEDVHARILRIGEGAGKHVTGLQLQITKVKQGKAAATWEVEPLMATRGAGYGTASPTTPPPSWERQPGQGWTQREAPQPEAPRPIAAVPARQQLPAATHPGELAINADRMASCLIESIQLWYETVLAAKNKGLTLNPNASDIRATACALFINGGAK